MIDHDLQYCSQFCSVLFCAVLCSSVVGCVLGALVSQSQTIYFCRKSMNWKPNGHKSQHKLPTITTSITTTRE
jgi:hypothetical protein